MATQPDNPHDRFFKESFSQPEILIDFLTVFAPEDVRERLDYATLTHEVDTFTGEQLAELLRILFSQYSMAVRLFGSCFCWNIKVIPKSIRIFRSTATCLICGRASSSRSNRCNCFSDRAVAGWRKGYY